MSFDDLDPSVYSNSQKTRNNHCACKNSILSGNGDGSFAPTANATRAQVAKMIALLLKGMIAG